MTLDRYSLRQRAAPRSRLARCEEAACDAHVYGWRTRLAVTDAARIRAVEDSGRHYEQVIDGDFVAFTFPAGQQCFAEHWVDKLQLFVARGQATTAELWVEQFGDNQQKLVELNARG